MHSCVCFVLNLPSCCSDVAVAIPQRRVIHREILPIRATRRSTGQRCGLPYSDRRGSYLYRYLGMEPDMRYTWASANVAFKDVIRKSLRSPPALSCCVIQVRVFYRLSCHKDLSLGLQSNGERCVRQRSASPHMFSMNRQEQSSSWLTISLESSSS